MSRFVLDSSIALAWCFVDEATPVTEEILESLETNKAIVPSLWPLEIANSLSLSLRKKRIDDAGVFKFLERIESLQIAIDNETILHALTDTFALSCHCELTAYDAAYLELAQRLDIPLASKDRQLCAAAKKLKITLIGAD
jgi:predicted nucleic acid-binding protein